MIPDSGEAYLGSFRDRGVVRGTFVQASTDALAFRPDHAKSEQWRVRHQDVASVSALARESDSPWNGAWKGAIAFTLPIAGILTLDHDLAVAPGILYITAAGALVGLIADAAINSEVETVVYRARPAARTIERALDWPR